MNKKESVEMKKQKRNYTILYIFSLILIIGYGLFIYYFNTVSVVERFSQKIIEQYEDSPVITSLADNCSSEVSNLMKVYCVNDFVYANYKYIHTMDMNPDNVVVNGDDCKGWSTFYKLAFDKLNVTSRMVYLEKHVFTVAYANDWYCVAEQSVITCQGLLAEGGLK